MTRSNTVEIDFAADDPGLTLLHCHHQDHQDEGFTGMVTYLFFDECVACRLTVRPTQKDGCA